MLFQTHNNLHNLLSLISFKDIYSILLRGKRENFINIIGQLPTLSKAQIRKTLITFNGEYF